MLSNPPTPKQTRALHAFLDLKRDNRGKPPVERELAKHLDVTKTTARQFLLALGEAGALEQHGEGRNAYWDVTEDGKAWAKMTRKLVNGDPPKKKRRTAKR